MHARIRPSRAEELHALLREPLGHFDERALHGALPRLDLPAAKL
jgi:hypothetical protein